MTFVLPCPAGWLGKGLGCDTACWIYKEMFLISLEVMSVALDPSYRNWVGGLSQAQVTSLTRE